MLQRALAFTLTLLTVGVWLSSETAVAQFAQDQSRWLRIESQHFEIHYLPSLAPELDRVVRSAERAYGRISGGLSFVLPIKVTQNGDSGRSFPDPSCPQDPVRARVVSALPRHRQYDRAGAVTPLREAAPAVSAMRRSGSNSRNLGSPLNSLVSISTSSR
jgi:hypothetical protein